MDSRKENEAFLGGLLFGIIGGIIIIMVGIRLIIYPMPRIVGFEQTGYFTKYKGTIYSLIPQTAVINERESISPNNPHLNKQRIE